MPKFLTPARLGAAVGVLTGLGAAATSLTNVLPAESTVGRAVVGSVGVLGACLTIVKWLDGQANWEQLQSAQAHDVMKVARAQVIAQRVLPDDGAPHEAAVLEDESPIDIDAEPSRLQDQVAA